MKRPLLQKRFAIVLIIQAVLILLLWFHYHAAARANREDASRENAALRAQQLLQEIGGEFEHMRTVSGALARSAEVQAFLTETDAEAFHDTTKTVSELVGKTALSSAGVVLLGARGEFHRFSGNLSDEACQNLSASLRGAGAVDTVIELDDRLYFCHSNPVLRTNGAQQMHLGNVVMLTASSQARRLLDADSGADADLLLMMEDAVLLSSRVELEGSSKAEVKALYSDLIWEPVENTGLEVVAALRGDAAAREERLFLTLSLAMAGLLLLTMLLIFRFLLRDMVRPMAAIQQNVRSIWDGTGRLALTGRSDFDELTQSINAMLDRTERYHTGLLDRQINTHFIVSTLIFIQSLSKGGETEKAAQAAELLAQLINHTKIGDAQINILEELAFVRVYIALMNLRYDDKFIVEVDLDERFCEYDMPCRLLQPIVENALTHGLRFKQGDCHLSITGKWESNAIVFEVSDNGNGMAAERLETLSKKLAQAQEGDCLEPLQHGVALCNIQRRIHVLYGAGYGIALRSVLNAGTTVTIRLPAVPSL